MVPELACFKAKKICSSVSRDFFIGTTSVQESVYHAGILFLNGAGFRVREGETLASLVHCSRPIRKETGGLGNVIFLNYWLIIKALEMAICYPMAKLLPTFPCLRQGYRRIIIYIELYANNIGKKVTLSSNESLMLTSS